MINENLHKKAVALDRVKHRPYLPPFSIGHQLLKASQLLVHIFSSSQMVRKASNTFASDGVSEGR